MDKMLSLDVSIIDLNLDSRNRWQMVGVWGGVDWDRAWIKWSGIWDANKWMCRGTW